MTEMKNTIMIMMMVWKKAQLVTVIVCDAV
jgi:hypothetical protein